MLRQAAAPLRVARGLAARAPTMAAVHQRRAFSDDRDVEVAKTEKQMVAILRRIADAVCVCAYVSRARICGARGCGDSARLSVCAPCCCLPPPPRMRRRHKQG